MRASFSRPDASSSSVLQSSFSRVRGKRDKASATMRGLRPLTASCSGAFARLSETARSAASAILSSSSRRSASNSWGVSDILRGATGSQRNRRRPRTQTSGPYQPPHRRNNGTRAAEKNSQTFELLAVVLIRVCESRATDRDGTPPPVCAVRLGVRAPVLTGGAAKAPAVTAFGVAGDWLRAAWEGVGTPGQQGWELTHDRPAYVRASVKPSESQARHALCAGCARSRSTRAPRTAARSLLPKRS